MLTLPATRCRTALVALGLVVALRAQAQAVPSAPPSRTAAVLAVLRRIPTTNSHVQDTPLLPQQNEYGCAEIAPHLAGCGLGWQQAFDLDLARELARDLCRAYGLEVQRDVPAPGGVAARLDAFDAARGIALELVGTVDRSHPLPVLAEEAPVEHLDREECAALRRAGVRVHAARAQAFWFAASGDRLTPTLGYLASVVTFLNDHTDGDDVDLSALVPARAMWIPLPRPTPATPPGVAVRVEDDVLLVEASKAATLTFAIDPAHALVARGPLAADPGQRPLAPRSPGAPLRNAGRPVLMLIPGLAGTGAVRLAIRQSDGRRDREATTADGSVLVVPGGIDTTKPWTLQITVEPGTYRGLPQFWVSGAERQ